MIVKGGAGLFDPCPAPSPTDGTRWYAFTQFLIWQIASRYFPVRVRGIEHLPKTGGVILAANHGSHLDPPLVAAGLPRQVHFLAKEDLFDHWLLALHLRNVNTHAVARGSGDRGAIRTCVEVLRQGWPLLIFPEGTRSEDGELQQAQNGTAMIALQADVPICPIHIGGTFEAWPRGQKKIKRHPISVDIGKPFWPGLVADMASIGDKRVRYDAVTQEMMKRIAALRDQWKARGQI
jgi:1-acyl-sn-glycerol-3-phosphate acyltransferase